MAHSEKGKNVLTDVQKAMKVLTCEELRSDYMGKHLEEQSVLVMRRLGRESQAPIDIVIAAVMPTNLFIAAVAAPELEPHNVTYPKALRAADYIHNRPEFKGRGVAESFTPEMVAMLATLYDDFESHKELVAELGSHAPVWNWTRQLVHRAMQSNCPAILVLRGEG